MRAIECTEPKCVHLHAISDPELRLAVLRHFEAAHPSVAFGAQAAAALIDEASYLDVKHGKKEDRLEFRDRPDNHLGVAAGG
jgi:hypothetical protein